MTPAGARDGEDDAEAEAPAHAVQPPAGDLVVRLLDGALQALSHPPVRARSSPASLLRGRIDVLVFEARGLDVTGLAVDRLVTRAEGVRIEPGLPPRFVADAVGMKATVSQTGVDRWVKRSRLPVKLRLTPAGVVARTGLGGVALGEVTTQLASAGSFLELRPTKASLLGVAAPVMPPVPGYLPLPPLPAGARLRRVEHEDGALTAWFDLGAIDEKVTPDLPRRLAKRLALPLPGIL